MDQVMQKLTDQMDADYGTAIMTAYQADVATSTTAAAAAPPSTARLADSQGGGAPGDGSTLVNPFPPGVVKHHLFDALRTAGPQGYTSTQLYEALQHLDFGWVDAKKAKASISSTLLHDTSFIRVGTGVFALRALAPPELVAAVAASKASPSTAAAAGRKAAGASAPSGAAGTSVAGTGAPRHSRRTAATAAAAAASDAAPMEVDESLVASRDPFALDFVIQKEQFNCNEPSCSHCMLPEHPGGAQAYCERSINA